MSSSRQKTQPESHGPCPSCGGRRVAGVVEDVTLSIRGRKWHFADVAHQACRDCGERIFSVETSRHFDRVILAGKRRPARAA